MWLSETDLPCDDTTVCERVFEKVFEATKGTFLIQDFDCFEMNAFVETML